MYSALLRFKLILRLKTPVWGIGHVQIGFQHVYSKKEGKPVQRYRRMEHPIEAKEISHMKWENGSIDDVFHNLCMQKINHRKRK